MMTREDILRELELLPVWQLRAPAASLQATPTLAPEAVSVPTAAQTLQTNLRIIVSEDAHYLFLLEAPKTSEEETLLQNMLKAMHAKARVEFGLQAISDLNTYQAKVIIAMGEAAAQAIGLQANSHAASSPDEMRAKVHQTAFGAVIVTFSPAHLLQNPADKARAWQDLCTAKNAIQAL